MSHKRATLITSVFGMAAGMAGPAAAQCPDDTADLFGDPITQSSGGETSIASGTVALGDFDNDENLDVAVSAGTIPDQVRVLLGDGTGSFPDSEESFVTNPSNLAAADFNGDGNLDLAVVQVGTAPTPAAAILLGNGDGTFQAPRSFGIGPDPRGIVTGDFDSDGNTDFAVREADEALVYIGYGDGAGNATIETIGVATDGTNVLAADDLDGDGSVDDLAVTNDDGTVTVLLGNGDRTFATQSPVQTGGSFPRTIDTGDVDGDGDSDVVTTDLFNAQVMANDGTGTLNAGTTLSVNGFASGGLLVTDLSQDAIADVIPAESSSGGTVLKVFISTGNAFEPQVDFAPSDDGNTGVLGGDFNNDGNTDLVSVTTEQAVVVLLNQCDPLTDDCPADLTGPGGDGEPDGTLTADDFFFYLGLFSDGDLAADLTGPGGDGEPDGSLTADDFFFYLGLFAAGCP